VGAAPPKENGWDVLGVAVGVAPVSEKVGTEGGCVEEGWEVGAEVDAPNLNLQRVRRVDWKVERETYPPNDMVSCFRAVDPREPIRKEEDEKMSSTEVEDRSLRPSVILPLIVLV
jgi:hypothetical protein